MFRINGMAENLKYPGTVGMTLGIVDYCGKGLGIFNALQCIAHCPFKQ